MQNLPSALIDRVQRHFRLLPPDLSASLLMLLAMFVFTATGVLVRMAAESMPIFQILFLRQVLTVALMSPLFWRHRNQILHPQGMRLHLFRGFAAVGAMSCGNAAVIYIPFADVTAIDRKSVV